MVDFDENLPVPHLNVVDPEMVLRHNSDGSIAAGCFGASTRTII
jgi:hypothetical protein